MKVYFVGAGPSDPELLTVKAANIMKKADVFIYAGSLINKDILNLGKPEALFFDSSLLSLTEIINLMVKSVKEGKIVVRLTSGEPSIYGAVLEQFIELDKQGIDYEIVPGVSSLFAAAAALKVELTAPGVSQTIIITRIEGRTKKPEGEELEKIASLRGTHCYYLSVDRLDDIIKAYQKQGWPVDCPVAVIYDATGKGECIVKGNFKDILRKVQAAKIEKKAIIIIGYILEKTLKEYSKLYDSSFSHGYRGKKDSFDSCK